MRTNRTIQKRRSARGAAIIYGAIATCSILGAALAAALVLLNVGFSIQYEEKLSRVTESAAQYAAAQGESSATNGPLESYIENLMSAMGMAPKDVSVDVASVASDYGPSVQVTVCNHFPLIGSRGSAPQMIGLQNTCTAAAGTDE